MRIGLFKNSLLNESKINEGTITPMQMEMNGKTLINKITIGTTFIGDVNGHQETFKVTGFGDRANAYKIFEVEATDGLKVYMKISYMYGCTYQVMENPNGDWDSPKNSKQFNLKSINI